MIKNRYILVILLTVYFFVSNKNLHETLFIDIGHNSIIKLLFFLFVTVLFFFSFFIFVSLKNTYIRVFTCLIFLTSSFASQFFFDISGNIININDIEIAILNKSSFNDLVINYRKDFFLNLSIFIFGFFLVVNGIKGFKFLNKKQIYFSLIFLFSLFSISFSRGGFATQGLPSQLQALIPLPLVFFSKNFEFSSQKLSFNMNKKKKNIILIIDESVSFEYFVKAKKIEKDIYKYFKHLQKFYSIHNCSAQAVFGLMNGIEVAEDNIVLRKSLWLQAKEAKYRTLYFSAQERPGKYQYLQNIKEITNIDEKYFFSHLKNKDRDRILLDKLIEVASKDNNQFIVVIKNGSHFPYSDKFDLKKFNLNKNSDAKLIYTYSIKENSINFLKNLLSKFKKESDIIYLSDHGQLFKKKKLSHCNSSNPEIQEWEIPLLYYINNKNKPINVTSNLDLYDFIIDKMGYTIKTNINKKNKLFYGNLNKRLSKQIKFKTLK